MFIGITYNKGLIKKSKWYARQWLKNGAVKIIGNRQGYKTKKEAIYSCIICPK
jgi:hypothetical protein